MIKCLVLRICEKNINNKSKDNCHCMWSPPYSFPDHRQGVTWRISLSANLRICLFCRRFWRRRCGSMALRSTHPSQRLWFWEKIRLPNFKLNKCTLWSAIFLVSMCWSMCYWTFSVVWLYMYKYIVCVYGAPVFNGMTITNFKGRQGLFYSDPTKLCNMSTSLTAMW